MKCPVSRPAAFQLGLMLACLCTCAPAPATLPATAVRPNIVFILIDDAGFSDLGSYGGEIETPNLDAMARAGVRFTNFHTASTCESSRTMLQSGVDHHRAGAGTLQVAIADNQRGQPGYEGYLSDRVNSLGELMHAGGYATYFSGKWNIGAGLARSPGARGWDRYLALENTGADNYEARVYAPFNREAVWWEDGHRAQLPPDFYSSHHYVSKLIQFIDEGRAADKPFMATLAFQAVHSPLQAHQPFIDKYIPRYGAGWDRMRAERYERQVRMGLAPAGLVMNAAMISRDWTTLSQAERQREAKKMAVFAGMLEEADAEVGRLREHLRSIGQLDHTVFIVMSDNGADAYDLSQLNLPFRIWYHVNDKLGYDDMGAPGSYVHYGQNWAAVSNTPLTLFKGTSGEGGMRVPFIVQMPGEQHPGSITRAFAYATDFVPTVLDLAGIALPQQGAGGKMAPTGKSLLPLLLGRVSRVHEPGEAFGFEGTGGEALFRDGYKIMRNGAPLGGPEWSLYRDDDWTEGHDLAREQPERVKAMEGEYQRYRQDNGVVMPEPGYNPLLQLLKNNMGVLLYQLRWMLVLCALVLLMPLAALAWWWRRRRRGHMTGL